MTTTIEVLGLLDPKSKMPLPFYTACISAGFPSPAEDHIEKTLDLNELLVQHPQATFFVRVSGTSMVGAGIGDKDILIVDRSIEPTHGKIVIAVLDGDLTVKRLHRKNGQILLLPESPNFKPIEIKKESDLQIWGVVINIIKTC
jgi:DNA polymerase V